MNERPAVNRLREAMQRADYSQLEDIAAEIVGRQAVAVALVEPSAPEPPPAREDPEQRQRELAEQRQRDLDAALADAIEVVARARTRNGRRVCSRHDGEKVRQVFELLRSVMGPDGGADSDPSFQ